MKTNPREIQIKDFTYELPLSRIAQHPLEHRDDSKLLVCNKGTIEQDIFKNLADHITEGSLLVFNDTRVINACLLFQTDSGKQVEVFCLAPAGDKEINSAFGIKKNTEWVCLVGNLKAWKQDMLVIKKDNGLTLRAERGERKGDSFIIRFSWQPGELTFAEILSYFGIVPLPPYMKRPPEDDDSLRYQTVYAQPEGSVAAPTAGLHFTPEVFDSLKNKNIQSEFLTLHVGAGTFKPVKSETISAHDMHAETFFVRAETIQRLINSMGKIVSVGTTSLRTMESLYWLGVKILNRTLDDNNMFIKQWEPYQTETVHSTETSLAALLEYMNQSSLSEITGRTEIIIVPGYEFRLANALITNFHQPQSTLLLLIAAFIGEKWKEVYDYALNNDFRFLSYGDSSLLFR